MRGLVVDVSRDAMRLRLLECQRPLALFLSLWRDEPTAAWASIITLARAAWASPKVCDITPAGAIIVKTMNIATTTLAFA
jgi:hypothetical protein